MPNKKSYVIPEILSWLRIYQPIAHHSSTFLQAPALRRAHPPMAATRLGARVAAAERAQAAKQKQLQRLATGQIFSGRVR